MNHPSFQTCDLCKKQVIALSSVVIEFSSSGASWPDVCGKCAGKVRQIIDREFPLNRAVGKAVRVEMQTEKV